jgi:hypothetical protein
MKKFLTLGALALTLAVASTQQASAWTNFKFGAGINLGYQAGGNNFGWGLFRNGQPPCPGECGGGSAPAPHSSYLQPGSIDQNFSGGMTAPSAPATGNPAQPQSYNRPNQTVNYQYYQYPYNYGYNYNGYNYGYYR